MISALATSVNEKSIGTDHLVATWNTVRDIYNHAVNTQGGIGCNDIEDELLFCMLGGFGITYEHALSASDVLCPLKPFSPEWDDGELFDAILSELTRRQFGPPLKDGSLRRYRYPNKKTTAIVRARPWVNANRPLDENLAAIPDARERRRFLCKCPGVGIKTASWHLRNIGMGEGLAIIDVHVLRALVEDGRVPANIKLPRDYDVAEDAFLSWCSEIDADPGAFDLFVWHWQRGEFLDGVG